MAKALLVIDMVNDFMPRSLYPEAKLPVEPAGEVIPKLKEVVDKCRRHGILVVYACDAHSKNDPEFKDWGEHAVAGTRGAEIYQELAPHKDDLVIRKKTFDCFSNPDMDRKLKWLGVTTLYLTGVVTDVCILASAKSAVQRGYNVFVLKDCVSGLKTQEDGLWKIMEEAQDVEVIPSRVLLGAIEV